MRVTGYELRIGVRRGRSGNALGEVLAEHAHLSAQFGAKLEQVPGHLAPLRRDLSTSSILALAEQDGSIVTRLWKTTTRGLLRSGEA